MKIKNIVIITLLSFLIHSIVGCGVMGKPKDDNAKNTTISGDPIPADTEAVMLGDDMRISAFASNFTIFELVISNINSEFISTLGDDYKILENNDSLVEFLTFMQTQSKTINVEDKQRLEQLLSNLQAKQIDFQLNSLLFYPFRTKYSYVIQEFSPLQNHIISVKFDLNETYQEDSFYNILFYQVKKSVKEIIVKESESEVVITSKVEK